MAHMLKVLIRSVSTEVPLLRSASVEYLQHVYFYEEVFVIT